MGYKQLLIGVCILLCFNNAIANKISIATIDKIDGKIITTTEAPEYARCWMEPITGDRGPRVWDSYKCNGNTMITNPISTEKCVFKFTMHDNKTAYVTCVLTDLVTDKKPTPIKLGQVPVKYFASKRPCTIPRNMSHYTIENQNGKCIAHTPLVDFGSRRALRGPLPSCCSGSCNRQCDLFGPATDNPCPYSDAQCKGTLKSGICSIIFNDCGCKHEGDCGGIITF